MYGGEVSGNVSADGLSAVGAEVGAGASGALSVMLNNDEENDDEVDHENCPFHYVVRPRKRKEYCKKSVFNIQITYIIAVIVWIGLIFMFQLYKTNIVGWIILAIPLIVFSINYSNLTCITEEVESEMLKGNFLSFAFLITIILINWSKIEDKSKYFRILLLALVLLMLSLVDIWVKPENMHLIRHIQTIFHTASLTLLVFGLYLYYSETIASDKNPTSVGDLSNASSKSTDNTTTKDNSKSINDGSTSYNRENKTNGIFSRHVTNKDVDRHYNSTNLSGFLQSNEINSHRHEQGAQTFSTPCNNLNQLVEERIRKSNIMWK